MKKLIARLLFPATLALMGGCAAPPVNLAPGSENVRVVKNVPLPDFYTEAGNLVATDGSGCGAFGASGAYEGAENTLKNQAHALGANLVQLVSVTEPHLHDGCGDNEYSLRGIAYKQSGQNSQEDADFDKEALAYRNASVKPVLSEEARRFKVQAEYAARDMKYAEAAELYGKALIIDPWWPQGHFNRAIVLSESAYYLRYRGAIREMKRYLLLVPDAPDAREVQNNIYKWERLADAEK